MPNRLAKETSPYLLQHANNPVDWYPWGEEALQKAQAEDKPVLLSIGYSACHWCHVMAHESFENMEIARIMNENFINIKVDREERPDVDHVYMESVQAMVGRGGWPLTVFLTPEGKPFYGGTYFPPEDWQGTPGFPKILKAVIEAYHNRRSSIANTVNQITGLLNGLMTVSGEAVALNKSILLEAYNSLEQSFDIQNGGFGSAPKFPNPLTLEFLLRYYSLSEEKQVLQMVNLTLGKMSEGGIYDQIGGGFHRYSTDGQWLVPHFEKMLYDNALLSQVYLHAYLVTGAKVMSDIVQETIDYVLRDMTDPSGGFYCSLDADTEGEEGGYYLWSEKEMREALGESLATVAVRYYGVTEDGNFDGRNILHRNISQEETHELQEAKEQLLKRRLQRNSPGRDEKVLASWNGLMLASLGEAAAVLQRRDYLEAAIKNGTFLKYTMISTDGRLMHSYKKGAIKINGFLEDYANVVQGFLSLHQATLDIKWLESAIDLTRMMLDECYDSQSGILYDTPKEQEAHLFLRSRNDFDGALPSGVATATLVLLKMAVLTGNMGYRDIAQKNLSSLNKNIGKMPLGYSQWLCALDFYLSSPLEIVLVGNKYDLKTISMAKEISARWLPNKIFAVSDPVQSASLKDLPLFKDRPTVDSLPTTYLCLKNTCKAPINDAAILAEELSSEKLFGQ